MLIFALMIAAPTPLTDIHQRDIACVVEIAVLANAQKRGAGGGDVQEKGRRWAGIVGDRITFESGQPKELVALAMNEAAKERTSRPVDSLQVTECTRLMNSELAIADASNAPLPKPIKPQ